MAAQVQLAKGSGPTLPDDTITRTFGVLGQRGTGKTNSAAVLVEEVVRLGGHVVILDPVGAWWGITRAGERRGLPGIVLGGEHGDVPLEETAGELVAELVVGRDYPVVVIDMKLLRKGRQIRFMADFCETLFHANRAPLHVVFEEADRALPQMVRGAGGGDFAAARLLGAGEDIVKLGRGRGLGATVVTQRPATVNKNVLEQVEALVVHRLIGTNDRRAIRGWIDGNGDEAATATVMGSIASLKRGEAWLYAPVLGLLERVQVRGRRTFDSSATPDGSAVEVERAARRAPVDLDVLRDRMAETVERARASDPKVLRARVLELERMLSDRQSVEPERVEVEVPVVPRARFDVLEAAVLDVKASHERVLRLVQEPYERVLGELAAMRADLERVVGAHAAKPAVRVGRAALMAPPPKRPTPTPAPAPNGAAARSGRDPLSGPQQRVLDAVAWLEAVGFPQPSKIQVGFIAGYRVGKKIGGTYGNILGQLRASGMIDYPTQGQVALSDDGRAMARWPEIEPTTEGLQQAIFGQLKDAERRVLYVVVEAYPSALAKKDVGESAGYQVGEKIGGTFGNTLGRLRTLGLIDYPRQGEVVATSVLFLHDAAVAA